MADNAIEIKVVLDDREIKRQADDIERKLKASLNAGGTGATAGTRALRDQEAAALRLAQAHARLASAGGNLNQAQTVLSNALARTTRETVATVNAQTQLIRVHQQQDRAARGSAGGLDFLHNSFSRLNVAVGALAAFGLVSLFERFGRAAFDAAIDIDRQVNTLKALTGSAEAAQKRFKELFDLAQKTPGLTTNLAATLDAQLRVFNVSIQAIDRLLPVIGRLNAISPIVDPSQFINNLTQLISTNFQVKDLRELVRASPLAAQLIKEIFNVDNPTNAEAIRVAAKRLGITTVERLAEELAKAGENNAALKNATESLGGQFDKLRDRLNVALAPIGVEIAKTLLPVFSDLVKAVETYGGSAARVFRENKNDIVAAAKEITAMVVEIGRLAGKLGELAAKSSIFEFIGRAAAETQDIINDPGNLFTTAKGPRLQEFERRLAERQTEAATIRNSPFLSSEERTFARASAGITGAGGRTGAGSAGTSGDRQRQKTELEKATQDVKELTQKVAALRQGGGKLFEELAKLDLLRAQFQILEKKQKDRAFISAKTALGIPLAPQLPGGIGLPTLPLPAGGNPLVEGAGLAAIIPRENQETLDADALRAARTRTDLADQRLRIQEVQIQNQVTSGLLSGAEAQRALNAARRESRGELIASLEAQLKLVGAGSFEGLQIAEQIEQTRALGVELSNTERFMRGFNSATESVADAFERFGQNVSRAFTNIKDLFNGLKQAVLGFFNDLLGIALQNLVRNTLGGLFGGGGGRGGGAAAVGGFSNVFRSLSSALGGGISAPASVTSTQQIQRAAEEIAGPATRPRTVAGAASAAASASGFTFGGLLGGLASAAPLLGLGLGAPLGGTNGFGQALGAIGSGAVGLGISFGAGVFGAGGGLAAASLAALGPAALIGAPLIVGAILLGKASQRKKDEQASGEFLAQALASIDQLAAGVGSGQIDGAQARSIFDTQILATFRQQISTLKTKSVVQSRLTNQVQDLRNVFEARIPPLIAAQEAQKAAAIANQARLQQNALTHSRLIPEFATGGRTVGGLAVLHPGEMVLNQQQQAAVRSMAGPSVFDRVGVPGINRSGIFDMGGIAGRGSEFAIVIDNLSVSLFVGKDDQTRIVVNGGSTARGRQVTVNNVKIARTNREL